MLSQHLVHKTLATGLLLLLVGRVLPALTPSGWNFNLTERCAETTRPDRECFYDDLSQCTPPGNWTLAVQSGDDDTPSCPCNEEFPTDTGAQSFLINAPGGPFTGPVTLAWEPHVDIGGSPNWRVNIKVDLDLYPHPCGANHFTWFAFMDHTSYGGGPLPRPDQTRFDFRADYRYWEPRGAARGIIGIQAVWDGKTRLIEISTVTPSWGDNYPGEPAVIDYVNDSTMQYVAVDASFYGVALPNSVEGQMQVDFLPILKSLIQKGFLARPAGGWPSTFTQAIYLAVETRNDTQTAAVVGDLRFTNWRIYEK